MRCELPLPPKLPRSPSRRSQPPAPSPPPQPLSKSALAIRLAFEATRSAEGVRDADDYAVLVVRRAGRGGDAVLRLHLQAFKGDRYQPGAGEGGVGPLRAREPGVHRAQCRA